MNSATGNSFGRGSTWHRWEPHIHTPGTVLNNQFGQTTWEEFSATIELCTPKISALGITDYYSVANYEAAIKRKNEQGLFSNIDLLFPNVEFRFGIGTAADSAVNAHLLFSPEDDRHVSEIKRFLTALTFRYQGDDFRCTKDDLVRLGRAHKNPDDDESAAYRNGALQFKVGLDQLQDQWEKNSWVRNNCVIAVAASQGDGSSGVRAADGSLEALRRNIEAFSHAIFSGNPRDREFWLGKKVESAVELEQKWGGTKPCLHGSDAHKLADVGKPDRDRFCWIKGEISFDSLRQACIEPDGRAFVGSEPPAGALLSRTIESISVTNADWMTPQQISLNPGLVAVIGARGSGKTALVDLIAAGGLMRDKKPNSRSFMERAKEHLQNSTVELNWLNGSKSQWHSGTRGSDELADDPLVQYLSQQFVEDLCSADGLAGSLVDEVERVIFNAHKPSTREGAANFQELLTIRCQTARQNRERNELALERISEEVLQGRELRSKLPELRKKLDDNSKLADQYKKARGALVHSDQKLRLERHEVISTALQRKLAQLQNVGSRLRSLSNLKDDLVFFRSRKSDALLKEFKQDRADANLTSEEWEYFRPIINRSADIFLDDKISSTMEEVAALQGPEFPEYEIGDKRIQTPIIKDNANLDNQTLNALQAEEIRLSKLIGIDNQNAAKLFVLNRKLNALAVDAAKIQKDIVQAETTSQNLKDLSINRRQVYEEIFDSIVRLEAEMISLYSPLKDLLLGANGALNKLSVVVRRNVNMEQWAQEGEKYLDLRKDGPFRGRGTLLESARKNLFNPWSSGSPAEVAAAIRDYWSAHEEEIRCHQLDSMTGLAWGVAIYKWLHSTQHVTVAYNLQYDGVDIERLSPGTRGIVLLLLYLALDLEDDRPLIIDQPEENLDPQSVYEELADRFRQGKLRRQIIIVTHNANLVVNTDADQVIVANAGSHIRGKLPSLTYESGGLESARIRKHVCNILEGGERAFLARAKRLRI